MTWHQFRTIPNGTRIFNHGFDQCVAVANHYHEQILGGSFVPVNSAYQWWTGQWPQITALYTRSTRPVAGALAVWDARWGGGHGHIGVVTSVLPDGRFTTIEQNAGQGKYRHVYRYTRSMTGILGFLVPKKNPAQPSQADNRPPHIHPEITEDGDEEMKLWIADVQGSWYLVVATGAGKPNAVALGGDSGMGGGGAAKAGIPVVRLRSMGDLRKVATV